MKVHDVIQGTPEWLQCRIGIPTCSCFDRILTPKTRKPSAQSEKYLIELCTEWLLGMPVDSASSQWMVRGSELEAEALRYYSLLHDVDVQRIGFATTDDGSWGGSPDFLVGDDVGGEIKCLSAVNHVSALLGATDDSYVLQVQGYMLLTGRKYWDRVWYNPAIQPVVQRAPRDEELCALLRDALTDFCERLSEMKAKLLNMGCRPKLSPQGAVEPGDERPVVPAPAPTLTKRERAEALAPRIVALEDTVEKEAMNLKYMLTCGPDDIANSIAGLSESMIVELENDVTLIEKGI